MSRTWYKVSYDWIKSQQVQHPEMSREEQRRHCSRHYPFAARRGWAYKAWLRAMNDVFGDRRKRARSKRMGQDDLFDE